MRRASHPNVVVRVNGENGYRGAPALSLNLYSNCRSSLESDHDALPAKRLVLPASAPHVARKVQPAAAPFAPFPALHNRLYYDARDDSPYVSCARPHLKAGTSALLRRKFQDRVWYVLFFLHRIPFHNPTFVLISLLHLPTLSLVVAALLYTLVILLTTAAPPPPPALSLPDPSPRTEMVRVESSHAGMVLAAACAASASRLRARDSRAVPHYSLLLPLSSRNVLTRARPLRRSNPRRLNAATNTLAASSLDDSEVSKRYVVYPYRFCARIRVRPTLAARDMSTSPSPLPAIPGAILKPHAQVRVFLFYLPHAVAPPHLNSSPSPSRPPSLSIPISTSCGPFPAQIKARERLNKLLDGPVQI
ncbi:hypothetical protein C8F04DRAFT_1266197 [Mycena alexandri]|uniref:Uncharacterized protein n=1 Tax=Mycena alexandri TaxID=1745969 RepID=A0AAD6SJM6_9AGAR|nr:hypothetical protein C8F04DRAFT_1266197 [Mycena alexandri]